MGAGQIATAVAAAAAAAAEEKEAASENRSAAQAAATAQLVMWLLRKKPSSYDSKGRTRNVKDKANEGRYCGVDQKIEKEEEKEDEKKKKEEEGEGRRREEIKTEEQKMYRQSMSGKGRLCHLFISTSIYCLLSMFFHFHYTCFCSSRPVSSLYRPVRLPAVSFAFLPRSCAGRVFCLGQVRAVQLRRCQSQFRTLRGQTSSFCSTLTWHFLVFHKYFFYKFFSNQCQCRSTFALVNARPASLSFFFSIIWIFSVFVSLSCQTRSPVLGL